MHKQRMHGTMQQCLMIYSILALVLQHRFLMRQMVMTDAHNRSSKKIVKQTMNHCQLNADTAYITKMTLTRQIRKVFSRNCNRNFAKSWQVSTESRLSFTYCLLPSLLHEDASNGLLSSCPAIQLHQMSNNAANKCRHTKVQKAAWTFYSQRSPAANHQIVHQRTLLLTITTNTSNLLCMSTLLAMLKEFNLDFCLLPVDLKPLIRISDTQYTTWIIH